jgi:hypothetical protein
MNETKNEFEGGNTMSPAVAAQTARQFQGLTPSQQKVFDQVKALRAYTGETGFKTTRSQNDLLQTLDGADLAAVLVALGK